ncbi:MAG TPA: cytochrome c biogenesis CcdA family protein [Natronosporangium sp.]|nr:cytochrome c biogenesis CcdA family protein [Natronosporangium sp.]
MGERFADIAVFGPLPLGIAVAAIAGLVSFLSPCVLPLVPGYLAYVTGLTGADLDAVGPRPAAAEGGTAGGAVAVATRARARGRVLAGGLLFVAGFGAVFVTAGVVAASVGRVLQEQQRVLEIGAGVLMLLFAAALLGLVPGAWREARIRRLPAAGVASAPVFGAVFALSWIPCVGPTIGAVLALGAVGGQPGRAAVLAAAYTLGLGLPFLAFGLGFRWVAGALAVVRRHGAWVTRVGAVLLVLVGLALLTGAWEEFVSWLRLSVGVGEVSL